MDDVQISEVMTKFRDHGDSDSWEQLYRLFNREIRAYLLKKVGPDNIDDCTSEFWLNLRTWLRKYDPQRKPLNLLVYGAWFQSKRFLQTERRQASERPRPESIVGIPCNTAEGQLIFPLDPHEGPEKTMMRKENCQIVHETIASIKKPFERDMARAYFLEGRVAKDVADEAGINHKTAWGHLVSARKEIGRKLARRLDEVQSHP